jgi:hypothetical protein
MSSKKRDGAGGDRLAGKEADVRIDRRKGGGLG